MNGHTSGQDEKGVASIQGVSSHKFLAVFLLLFVSTGLVDSAARECFFGPPPKPETGNPDPRHWMKQVMGQVRKNCPGRRQTAPAEQPATNTGASGIPAVCPSTWIQWEGNCYKATGQALNWAQAREECVQMGGTMVVPQSESETQFLLGLIPSTKNNIWINCNDIQVDGQWECEEETEVTFTEMPWYNGEPNDYYGPASENCGVLSVRKDPLGKWADTLCSWDSYTVCKQPLYVV